LFEGLVELLSGLLGFNHWLIHTGNFFYCLALPVSVFSRSPNGHEVRTAYTGETAVLMLEKMRFDLIIAKYWLPRIRGDQLAALVKHKWPYLPIILTTANMQDFHKEDHPIAGVDCLLNKPFTISQLREAMDWVFARYAEKQAVSLMPPEAHWGPFGIPKETRKPPRRNSDR